jgi:DNA polymerase I
LFPDIEEMHTDEKHVTPWVEYSTFDAEITYFLRETLAYKLSSLETKEEGLNDMSALYTKYWLPFGELLTDMERTGIKIDLDHLKEAELTAERDKIEYEQKFLEWVHKVQDDAHEFNPSSAQQLQQLLFAPFKKKKIEKKKNNGINGNENEGLA